MIGITSENFILSSNETQMLIKEYQNTWEEDFTSIRKILEEELSSIEIQIEHVGSTAVKFLAAKPIIDIDMVYIKRTSFINVKKGLENLGYYHNGDQGIEGREVFKRIKNKDAHPVLDSIDHHLYVCHIENEELQRHLRFRNYLRANENERKEYEKLKYEIARKANQDRKEYAHLKEDLARKFIESVLKKSEK